MKLVTESMESYLSTPGLSSSALVEYAKSMRAGHAYMARMYERPDSAELKFGTFAHELWEVGAEQFWNRYTLPWAGPDRRTNEGKAAYAEWLAEQEATGRPVIDLTFKEIETLRGVGIALSTIDDWLTREWLSQPHVAERSVYWTEIRIDGYKKEQIDMKCRPDRLITVESPMLQDWMREHLDIDTFDQPTVVMDLKTSSTADPDQWTRRFGEIEKWRYDLKAAHYLAGTEADAFCWLVVEKKPPYHTSLIWLGKNRLRMKLREREDLLSAILVSDDSREYPGYRTNVIFD